MATTLIIIVTISILMILKMKKKAKTKKILKIEMMTTLRLEIQIKQVMAYEKLWISTKSILVHIQLQVNTVKKVEAILISTSSAIHSNISSSVCKRHMERTTKSIRH